MSQPEPKRSAKAPAGDGRPAPTPCRSALGDEDIPEFDDVDATRPVAGVVRISLQAMEARLRRIFTPNSKGLYKVSQELVQQFKQKKGRRNLEQLFQSCGFDPDLGSKTVTGC